MRRKITILTAVGLCLVLAFGAALASERGRDASADRSKRGNTNAGGTGFGEFTGTDLFGDRVFQSRSENQTGLNKARAMLISSTKQDDSTAITTLNEIADMDLPNSPEADKLLAQTYLALAELHDHAAAKEAHYVGMALANTSEPAQRARLTSRIQQLGGNPVAFALSEPSAQATPETLGWADFCGSTDNATAVMTAVSDFYTDGLDIEYFDPDWYTIDVMTADPALGLILYVETCSDSPGTYEDDTDIYLIGNCDTMPTLAYGGDGGCNAPFMSAFTSPCLASGTYYLVIQGWLGGNSTAYGIDVNIHAVADCEVPLPDEYEPDNDRANAKPIGHDKPYTHENAMMTGHVAKDIQAHNIFPIGDIDWMRFSLKETAMVTMETADCFATIFNDFDPDCLVPYGHNDTKLDLMMGYEQKYGGLCNQQTAPGSLTIIGPPCMDDMDCDLDGDGLVFPDDDDLVYPIDGFPACLPWYLFGETYDQDTPIASDDDGGISLASKLELCLPRTNNHSPSKSVQGFEPDYNWYIRVYPYSASATFDYEVLVHTGEKCHFECEPNDGFWYGAGPHCAKENTDNHIVIGEDIHGFYDFFVNFPDADVDMFTFDLPEGEWLVSFETDGYDSYACDTYIEVFVGPDDEGAFYLTGVWSEDQGPGWLSAVDAIMPSACELMGPLVSHCAPGGNAKSPVYNTNTGPQYWMMVTSNYFNPNFPWTLHTSYQELGLVEVDDFGDCDSGSEAMAELGQTWTAAISPSCDYDGYKFSITENTDVTLETAGMDTAMQLVDCATGAELACDDDGGPGLYSLIYGCLPGPADYCVRVRGWSSSSGSYELTLSGTGGCTPGPIMGDGLYSCNDFDGCP
jgi:hypothetical protein